MRTKRKKKKNSSRAHILKDNGENKHYNYKEYFLMSPLIILALQARVERKMYMMYKLTREEQKIASSIYVLCRGHQQFTTTYNKLRILLNISKYKPNDMQFFLKHYYALRDYGYFTEEHVEDEIIIIRPRGILSIFIEDHVAAWKQFYNPKKLGFNSMSEQNVFFHMTRYTKKDKKLPKFINFKNPSPDIMQEYSQLFVDRRLSVPQKVDWKEVF